MRNKNSKRTTVILVIVFLVGLSVMLYPAVSNWWNTKVQSRVVADYQKAVNEMDSSDPDKVEGILKRAHEYNKALSKLSAPLYDYEQVPDYDNILDITGTGVMAIVNIPQIGLELPVYHGTSEGVLNVAVGHLQGTSLPVGGKGTHAVISAHRGLPSAELFSYLDKLVVGDEFTVTVLKEVLTYEVEEINIVLPGDHHLLSADPESDLLTLMTCTPYGVNTHRLLVRARRVSDRAPADADPQSAAVKISPDAVMLDSMQVVPIISAFPVALLIGWWLFGGKKKKFPHKDPLSVLESDKDKTKS